MPDRTAAVVGAYEYPRRLVPDLTPAQIKAECAARALADAGLEWSDVDALYDVGEADPTSGVALCEYLGLRPSVVDTTVIGGSSYEFHAGHAKAAIGAGHAQVALLTYGSNTRSEGKSIGTAPLSASAPIGPSSNMEDPWGLTLIGNYALVAQRHRYLYGTTEEQLATIAVVTRRHGTRNPDAVQGLADLGLRTGEITVSDVLASRLVADPLHVLDSCIISDGGGAVVIASGAIARQCARPPVWIIGTGEAVKYPRFGEEITTSAADESGRRAFGQAGVSPSEIDIAMLYDSFTITALVVLEDLGFCDKGEGGAFVQEERLAFDSPLKPALNTDGGGLSSNHPGRRGIFLLIEAVRQLRGESHSQVPDARLAVAHGNGGYLGTRHSGATVVLAAD